MLYIAPKITLANFSCSLSGPKTTEVKLVSSDIIGEQCGGMVDGLLTNVVEADGKQLLKVVAWYDNETGYTAQMIRTMKMFM